MSRKERERQLADMNRRDAYFVLMTGRSIVRSLAAHVPLAKKAGYEARKYYNASSAHRRYWEGWCDALDLIVSVSEGGIRDLMVEMGGDKKAHYIAWGVMQGLSRYEDVVNNGAEPLKIVREDFNLFHEEHVTEDDDGTEGGVPVPEGL